MGARKGAAHPRAHLLAVLAVGEVVEVPIVEVAGARGPLAWLGAHLAGVNAAFPQKLAVGHREGLADGLSNELGLWRRGSSSQGVSHPPSGPPNPLTSSESNPPTHLGQDSQETAYKDFGKIATVLGNWETGPGQGRFRDLAPASPSYGKNGNMWDLLEGWSDLPARRTSEGSGLYRRVGAPGHRSPAAHIIRVENVADHLVEPVAMSLGCRAPGQPPAGHNHQHTADVRDVGDGLQGVVHHGLLEAGEIRPGQAAEASVEPPRHQRRGPSPVPGSRPSEP